MFFLFFLCTLCTTAQVYQSLILKSDVLKKKRSPTITWRPSTVTTLWRDCFLKCNECRYAIKLNCFRNKICIKARTRRKVTTDKRDSYFFVLVIYCSRPQMLPSGSTCKSLSASSNLPNSPTQILMQYSICGFQAAVQNRCGTVLLSLTVFYLSSSFRGFVSRCNSCLFCLSFCSTLMVWLDLFVLCITLLLLCMC